jgi:hypothetical protein
VTLSQFFHVSIFVSKVYLDWPVVGWGLVLLDQFIQQNPSHHVVIIPFLTCFLWIESIRFWCLTSSLKPFLRGKKFPSQSKWSISKFLKRFMRSRGNMCVFLAIGSFAPRFRWPSAHSKDRHGGDCCSYTRHWKCPQIVPVVEGEIPLLLIYYRLSPMSGWRVIESYGHPHLQGSFQTTNTKETLTATFLLHVRRSSDAVKKKLCGLEDTA